MTWYGMVWYHFAKQGYLSYTHKINIGKNQIRSMTHKKGGKKVFFFFCSFASAPTLAPAPGDDPSQYSEMRW